MANSENYINEIPVDLFLKYLNTNKDNKVQKHHDATSIGRGVILTNVKYPVIDIGDVTIGNTINDLVCFNLKDSNNNDIELSVNDIIQPIFKQRYIMLKSLHDSKINITPININNIYSNRMHILIEEYVSSSSQEPIYKNDLYSKVQLYPIDDSYYKISFTLNYEMNTPFSVYKYITINFSGITLLEDIPVCKVTIERHRNKFYDIKYR